MVEECSVGGIFDGGGWICNVSIFLGCVPNSWICKAEIYLRLLFYPNVSFFVAGLVCGFDFHRCKAHH